MTREELKDLIECGDEIEFNYSGKRFSITYYERNGRKRKINQPDF